MESVAEGSQSSEDLAASSWPQGMGDAIKTTDPSKEFRVIEQIGKGGFEGITVHRAQRKTGAMQIVAVKKFNLRHHSQQDIRMLTKEAEKEIKTLQQCRVPGVVSYYGAYHYNKEFWIVMELCEGGSLRQVMDKVRTLRGKRLNERPKRDDMPIFQEIQIGNIMKQSLVALDALHRNKLIHRDIKSANVLLSKDGKVKLGDLGAAAAVSHTSKMFTSLVGTAYFVAPEVLDDEEYGCEIDVWSLGIMALELAEYVPPLFELSMMDAMRHIQSSEPPTLREPDKWSADFDNFIRRCLVRDRTQRATTAELLKHPFVDREFVMELKHFVLGDGKPASQSPGNQLTLQDRPGGNSTEREDQAKPAPRRQAGGNSRERPAASRNKEVQAEENKGVCQACSVQ